MASPSFITRIVTAKVTDETPITFEYENPGADYLTKLEVGITLDQNGTQMVCNFQEMPLGNNSYTFRYSSYDLQRIWTVLLDTGDISRQFYLILRSTMSDGTYKKPYSFTLSCVDYNPEIEVELWDANADLVADITYDDKTFVAHKSNVGFTITPTAKKGGNVANYWIECDGKKISNQLSGSFTTPIKNNLITIRCDDNRGNWTTNVIRIGGSLEGSTYEWIPYIPLDCNAKATFDANSELQVTVTGKFYNGNFGGLNGIDNSLQLRYYVEDAATEAGSWKSEGYLDVDTITDSDGTYHYSFTNFDYDYNSSYKLSVQVIDAVSTYTTEEIYIPSVTPVFDWSNTDFNFNVDVYIKGKAVPYVVESSIVNNDTGWSYRKWSDGTAECWRNLTVRTKIDAPSSSAGLYSSGQLTQTNLSFPFYFKTYPTVTVGLLPTGTTWAFVMPSNTGAYTSSTGSYQLMATSKVEEEKNYIFTYNVKGRWK